MKQINNLIVDFYKHTGKLPGSCCHHDHTLKFGDPLNLKSAFLLN